MGIIASFANKVFEVNPDKIYTFDGLTSKSALQTEKQDVDGSKPSTYIKGSDLDTLAFSMKLDVSMGINPRNEWGDWKQILDDQTAYPFYLAGIPVNEANFLLNSITPSNVNIDCNGYILSLELALEFEEFVRAGSKKEKTSATSKSTTSVPGLYDMVDSETYTIPDNTDLKRDNADMSMAALDGV